MDVMHWYADWQDHRHASHFDFGYALDNRNLVRHYESYNDVRLLNERIDRSKDITLFEVGCATGEFYRYLRIKYPGVGYYGIDISQPAIALAKERYPKARFFVTGPEAKLSASLKELSMPENHEIVYAKDVILHQTRPFEFLSDLVKIASEALVIRCRTRDHGPTELDPEHSCQYHYGGWMPYIVMNLDEMISYIREKASRSEIVVYRNHMILGGQNNRYLPKDCYLKATGTAETAIGVFKKTDNPGKLVIEDHPDMNPTYTLDYRLKRYVHRLSGILR